MTGSNIQRFKEAQASPHSGFQSALEEIQRGAKRGHWVWYVFPQLDGLGTSGLARAFAIHGTDEAEAYLQDGELRARLLAITEAVADQLRTGTALRALMGSDIDARKVVSSLTLFGHVARTLGAREHTDSLSLLAEVAEEVLTRAAGDGYPPCRYTLRYVTHSA
jgi:uncharacterized protein (DUF1810 family)